MSDIAMPEAPALPPGSATGSKIFNEVVFHIVTNDKLSQETAAELKAILLAHGATEAPVKPATASSRVTIDLEESTHIISANTDFPGYADAVNLMIPVVTPEWVKHSALKKRVAHVRPFTPDPRFFFSNVVATVAELPPGDKEAICGGIVAMGGQYSHHLTKFTTHIVALNTDNDKCRQATNKKLSLKIVLPHWFDDCLKLGRRIDEKPYELPNPEIESLGAKDPIPTLQIPDLRYTHAHQGGPMSGGPPKPPREGYNIFNGKRVMLGLDLMINDRLREVIVDIITQTKGKVTSDVDEADVYIGQYREGDDYVLASRRSAHVGNLTWLYWMFAHGEWTNPYDRLLHYPIVRGGIPGMKDKVITVSNYGGDARMYLENLIEACGAKFTKSMKADNTHLITARAHSEKCDAAKEWNIHMVNHLWLEDSYARWKVMTISDPKYTHFPRRTNLTEVVGQTRVDLATIVQFYEEEEEVEVEEEGDTSPSTAVISSTAVHSPPATAIVQRTPAPTKKRKVRPDQDQNEEPPAPHSTGRKAKERATARLHNTVMPDLVLYQKELKRKGGVMGNGRSRGGSVDSPDSKRAKSSDAGDEVPVKKGKKRPKPTIFLLITAYSGWWENPQKEDAEKKILADLGIKCVDDPAQCTYLAAPHLVRTEKFCCALARAPVIVSIGWVEACISEERVVKPDDFLLQDPVNEKRLGVKLAKSLARAKENNGKLLEGQAVYCTPGVQGGGYEVFRKIVEANGGVCVLFRTAKRPANAPDSDKLVLLSDSAADKKLWQKFEGMAANAEKTWYIYKPDWLLETAMNQKVVWSDRYKIEE